VIRHEPLKQHIQYAVVTHLLFRQTIFYIWW